MLSEQEEKFIIYWEKNRERDKKLVRQLLIGLPLGLLISGGILLCLDLNWYERANMVANASLNPYVLLIGIISITIFTSVFFKKYQWEMKEQHYRELLFKREHRKKEQTELDAAK